MGLYLVAVVLQYTKKHTHTHSKQYTTHKITNTIFQPNKEPKVEESASQNSNTENTEHEKIRIQQEFNIHMIKVT
jgi:hypothetical protein